MKYENKKVNKKHFTKKLYRTMNQIKKKQNKLKKIKIKN